MSKPVVRGRSAPIAPRPDPPSFAQLLQEAINRPGTLSQAYSYFHNYSISNQLLASFECLQRGIEPGPIHTFSGWLKLKRAVRKGEKGILLCMPVTWTVKLDSGDPNQSVLSQSTSQEITRRRFIYRPNWFVLSQTDGEPLQQVLVPYWNESLALEQLQIQRVPFLLTNGNVQGYAEGRNVAVSPIAHLPHKTLIHEIAHIVLGHTAERLNLVDDDQCTPRDLREVEAEGTAYLVIESLGLPGGEFSRGYLQHWLGSQKIDERTAQKIFHAADVILKAGKADAAVHS